MPQSEIDEKRFGNELAEQPPDFDPQLGEYRSPVLMRVMLVIVNLASLVFARSFLQSWYSVHGTTPVWIPLVFLLIPLGSLVFIYYYMGRIGSERIIKLICFAVCILHISNLFSPIDSSQISRQGGLFFGLRLCYRGVECDRNRFSVRRKRNHG